MSTITTTTTNHPAPLISRSYSDATPVALLWRSPRTGGALPSAIYAAPDAAATLLAARLVVRVDRAIDRAQRDGADISAATDVGISGSETIAPLVVGDAARTALRARMRSVNACIRTALNNMMQEGHMLQAAHLLQLWLAHHKGV